MQNHANNEDKQRESYLISKSLYDDCQIVRSRDLIIVLVYRLYYSKDNGVLWSVYSINPEGHLAFHSLNISESEVTDDVDMSNILLIQNDLASKYFHRYNDIRESYQKQRIRYFLNNL